MRVNPFPQRPNPMRDVIAPYPPWSITSTNALSTAGTIYACRVLIPEDGTLHDLMAHHGTASGNHRLGIYDTGDAASGSRTSLYDSGSVALSGSNVWQVAGDPDLAVTAGQELDFVLMADNTTATFGRVSSAASSQFQLPAGYGTVLGGASPKYAWAYAVGAYAAFPATITEANCSTSSGVIWPMIAARLAR